MPGPIITHAAGMRTVEDGERILRNLAVDSRFALGPEERRGRVAGAECVSLHRADTHDATISGPGYARSGRDTASVGAGSGVRGRVTGATGTTRFRQSSLL